jgi:hypothetical protein
VCSRFSLRKRHGDKRNEAGKGRSAASFSRYLKIITLLVLGPCWTAHRDALNHSTHRISRCEFICPPGPASRKESMISGLLYDRIDCSKCGPILHESVKTAAGLAAAREGNAMHPSTTRIVIVWKVPRMPCAIPLNTYLVKPVEDRVYVES